LAVGEPVPLDPPRIDKESPPLVLSLAIPLSPWPLLLFLKPAKMKGGVYAL